MNPLDHFEKIAGRARLDSGPQPNVTSAVMRRVGTMRDAPPVTDVSLWTVAALGAAAAVIFCILGYDAWQVLNDPWIDLFQIL